VIIRVTTTDVAHGGYCVGRDDGMVVFVTGALPGEVVEAEVTGQKSRLWYARTVTVLTPSPDRVPHIWPLAERTGIGGADLGHVSLEAGRRWKASVIQTQLRRLAHRDLAVEVEAAPTDEARSGLAWRTRLAVRIDESGRPGMYAAKSHRLIPVDGMPLAHEDIQDALKTDIETGFKRELAGQGVSYVRSSGSGLMVHVHPPGEPVLGLSRAPVRETVSARGGTWSYDVPVDGFWQVHREAPPVLVDAVLAAAEPVNGPAADLYAGAGLFTLPLAERRRDGVTAVEASAVAVPCLRRNVREHGVDVYCDDVTAHLRTCEPGAYSLIVADPPRSGAGREAVDQMIRIGPDRIVYVACDPAALARDVNWLGLGGYDLVSLRAFDLFPMTHHVEAVAVLEPARR